MWKLILLVLFTFSHKSTQAKSRDNSLPGNRCGDCGDLDQIVYSNTGHYCHPEDEKALEKDYNYTAKDRENVECMPSVYKKIYPVRHYCCFWSPQLGCGIVVGELYYEVYRESCAPCLGRCPMTRMNYGNRPTIPLAMPFLALWQMLIPLNQLG